MTAGRSTPWWSGRRCFVALATVVFVALGSADANAATTWRRYVNGRWGYSIERPTTLVSQPEPENGGGLAFISSDGKVQLFTYGEFEIDAPQTTAELQREHEWNWIGSHGRVTYRATKSTWFVSSGITDDNRVFYERLEHRTDPVSGLVYDVVMTISYPQSVKSTWNPITERIAKSFKVTGCPGGC